MNKILGILFLIGFCQFVWYEFLWPMIDWIIDKIMDLIEYIRRRNNGRR